MTLLEPIITLAIFLAGCAVLPVAIWVTCEFGGRFIRTLKGDPSPATFTEAQQLAIDHLRFKGYTKGAAQREVARFAEIHDTHDLITNPQREGELRKLAPQMANNLLSEETPDSLRDMYLKAWLEQSKAPEARFLEQQLVNPETMQATRRMLIDYLKGNLDIEAADDTQQAQR